MEHPGVSKRLEELKALQTEIQKRAIQANTPLYVKVRDDGYVLSYSPWTVTLYVETWHQTAPVLPQNNGYWKWVKVDPRDPTAAFTVDSDGTFWAGREIPYGRT